MKSLPRCSPILNEEQAVLRVKPLWIEEKLDMAARSKLCMRNDVVPVGSCLPGLTPAILNYEYGVSDTDSFRS